MYKKIKSKELYIRKILFAYLNIKNIIKIKMLLYYECLEFKNNHIFGDDFSKTI